MERRDVLRYAAALTGAAIAAPITTQVLASALNISEKPLFFDKGTFESISQVMDTILPRTDSPSATDVKVNFIMDNMFNKVFDEKYQQGFMKRFNHLNNHLKNQQFFNSTTKEQLAILQQIESLKSEEGSLVYQAYIDLKQQTITYYLSTEEIAENFLNYLPSV